MLRDLIWEWGFIPIIFKTLYPENLNKIPGKC